MKRKARESGIGLENEGEFCEAGVSRCTAHGWADLWAVSVSLGSPLPCNGLLGQQIKKRVANTGGISITRCATFFFFCSLVPRAPSCQTKQRNPSEATLREGFMCFFYAWKVGLQLVTLSRPVTEKTS